MAVMKKKRTKRKSIDTQYNGTEPLVVTEDNYTHALNWYNYAYELDKAREFLIEYAKNNLTKDQLSCIRNCPKSQLVTTVGWQARIMSNGNKLSANSIEYFSEKIASIIETGKANRQPKVEKANKISVRDRIIIKAKEMIAVAEADVIDRRESMYGFLVANEVSAPIAAMFKEYYQPFYDEVRSNDPYVKELFGKRLKGERVYWKSVIDDIDRFCGNKKVTRVRKPRTKKAKSAVALISKLQYQIESAEYKIASINPVNIVGAQQLWVFNTKQRKLTKYDAVGPAGLQVSRSSIRGFDDSTSAVKRVRKPEDVINIVTTPTYGKVSLRKLMDNINTKAETPSGRINNDTVLLRVIK